MTFDAYVISDHEDRRKADDLIHEFIKVVRSSHSKDLRESIADLRDWCPEGTPEVVKKDCEEAGVNSWEVPFFTGICNNGRCV